MDIMRDVIEKSLFNQVDDSSTPISLRLPASLNNELEELALTVGNTKTHLATVFIKAGVAHLNALLAERSLITQPAASQSSVPGNDSTAGPKKFLLNTNFNNNEASHYEMLKNREAAAFCKGWKEYICQLKEGDRVYLYQSGVGIIAAGTVHGDLIKGEYDGVAEDKYAKALTNFIIGFKAIPARRFKEITGGGANFRRTMVELSDNQADAVDQEISDLMSTAAVI